MNKILFLILALIFSSPCFAEPNLESATLEDYFKEEANYQNVVDKDQKEVSQEEVKTPNNSVSILLGAGITEYLVWFEGSDLSTAENFGFVYGLQYTRNNLFSLFDKEIGWSALALSHQTYLTGPNIQLSKLNVGILGGVGITDVEIGIDNSDPFNPELTEKPISGFVLGVQLQYSIYENWFVSGTATSNMSFIGGVGFGF